MTRSYPIRRRAWLQACLSASCLAMTQARAASDTAVHLVVPLAAGSAIDLIARAAQPILSRLLGAPVVIENQPGASGTVAMRSVSRAAPDGSTLCLVSNNAVITPGLLKSLPYDVIQDFTPIAIVGAVPMALVVNPERMPASHFQEFVALLKRQPGHFNFGSSGNGTILHLAAQMVLDAAGVSARHIPYNGVRPMVSDLLGGQIDFGVSGVSGVGSYIRAGRLRSMGLLTADRISIAPEWPTLAEQGLPNFSVEAWFAMIGPKGMAADRVKSIHAAIVAAFADPSLKDQMDKQGNIIKVSTPEQARATFASEAPRYAALIRKIGLEPQ